MTAMKVADVIPGNCFFSLGYSAEETRKLEVEVLEKIKGSLPPGAWTVEARLEITVGVQGTPEMVKSFHQGKSIFYRVNIPMEHKDIELTAKETVIREVEGTLLAEKGLGAGPSIPPNPEDKK
jgi:hypothetical protein